MCLLRRQQQTQNHQDQTLHGSQYSQKLPRAVKQSFWRSETSVSLLCSGGGVGLHEWSFYKQSADLGPLERSHINKMLNIK